MQTIAFAFLCPRSAVRARHCQTGQWAVVGSDLESGSEKAAAGEAGKKVQGTKLKHLRPQDRLVIISHMII